MATESTEEHGKIKTLSASVKKTRLQWGRSLRSSAIHKIRWLPVFIASSNPFNALQHIHDEEESRGDIVVW